MTNLTKTDLRNFSYQDLRTSLKFARDYYEQDLEVSLRSPREELEEEFIAINDTRYCFWETFNDAYDRVKEQKPENKITFKDIHKIIWDISENMLVRQLDLHAHFDEDAERIIKQYRAEYEQRRLAKGRMRTPTSRRR